MPELIGKLTEILFRLAQAMAEGPKGSFRSEDFISAGAAFLGEVCMRKAADFDFDNHSFTPGQSIFSQKVNLVLSGDRTDWGDVPPDTAFGGLYNVLTRSREIAWPAETFPSIADTYELFAKASDREGRSTQWGYVPLSVSSDHIPRMPPLRSAFELRRVALGIVGGRPDIEVLRAASSMSLFKALVLTRSAIDGAVAIRLAMETINGMAKTAPVLPRHIQESAKSSSSAK